MTETPRTDRVEFCILDCRGETHDVVGRAFARELERENARLMDGYLELLGQVEQAREGFGIYHNSPSMASAIEKARLILLPNV